MNNLDLDINKYNCNELYEIFSINEKTRSKDTLLLNHLNSYKNNVMSNNTLTLFERDNISNFLNDVLSKLLKNLNINNENDTKNLTFSSLTNNIISNTSNDHPVIANQNSIAGSKANTYDGDTPSNTNFSPGYINPINVKSIRRTLNIDSKFRDNYFNSKSTDFIVNIPDQFKKIVKMKVTAFEIPTSIYNINSTNENNFFYYSKNELNNASMIVLENGNYSTNFNSFTTNFNNIETNINNNLDSDISYSIDPISGKSRFRSDNSFNLYFNTDICGNYDLNSQPILKLGWLLGFRLGQYTSEYDTDISCHVIISEGICNLESPKYLFLSINDYTNAANNHFVAAFNSSILSQDIIARFSYTALINESNIYNYSSSINKDLEEDNRVRTYFGPVNINRLHIQIFDEYGRVVDFNNMDWSLTLALDMLYD